METKAKEIKFQLIMFSLSFLKITEVRKLHEETNQNHKLVV